MKWGPFAKGDIEQAFHDTQKTFGDINALTVVADFGNGNCAVALEVRGLAWVRTTTVLLYSVTGASPDHDPGDAVLEELRAGTERLIAGKGIDVLVYAPNYTTGKYNVHIIGINDQ